MIAVVGDGQNNPGSLRLHKSTVSKLWVSSEVWDIKGDWRDTVMMQRPLNDGDWTLPE